MTLVWTVLGISAFIAYCIWTIRDGRKVIYAKGTWLELKDPDNYTNIDSEFGPDPQYVRLWNDWTKSKSQDRWCSMPGYDYFEPDGKLKAGRGLNIENYKALVDPVLVMKLEKASNASESAQHKANVKRIRERRAEALKLYLAGKV